MANLDPGHCLGDRDWLSDSLGCCWPASSLSRVTEEQRDSHPSFATTPRRGPLLCPEKTLDFASAALLPPPTPEHQEETSLVFWIGNVIVWSVMGVFPLMQL